MRIGYGFDSHEFRPGIPLKIGGIMLAHDKGLGGHSDGDVLLHAITDALLGAIAAPDIGALFPPSDPKWKGADSVIFLREALKRVREAGYVVANIDSSLILAAPEDRSSCDRHSYPRGGVARGAHQLRRPEGEDARRIEPGQCRHRAGGSTAGERVPAGKRRQHRRSREDSQKPPARSACQKLRSS